MHQQIVNIVFHDTRCENVLCWLSKNKYDSRMLYCSIIVLLFKFCIIFGSRKITTQSSGVYFNDGIVK